MKLDKKIIAERLKLWGKRTYSSNEELAKALDISKGVLQSSYLNGRSLPNANIIARLKQLGCDLDWLLSDEPEVQPQIVKEKPEDYSADQLTSKNELIARIKELEDHVAILVKAVSLINKFYELQSDQDNPKYIDTNLLLNKLNIKTQPKHPAEDNHT